MAKRAPANEKPYDPLDPSLTQSVLMGPGPAQERANPVEAIVPPSSGSESAGGAYWASNGQVIPMPRSTRPESRNGDASDRRGREKRVVLSRDEERNIEQLVARMGDGLRTSLKLSHVLRAAVAVLLHAEGELISRAQSAGHLQRPSNGDPVALAEFEVELAKMLSQALRDAPLLR